MAEFLVTLPCHPELKGTKSGTKWVPSQDIHTILNTSNLPEIEKFINALTNDERYQVNIQINEYINSLDGKHQLNRLFKILRILKEPLDRKEIFTKLELANKTDHYNKYLRPLLNVGWIEWTIPEKPTSRLQKYRLTDKGRKLLE